jgi:hypothetical protein
MDYDCDGLWWQLRCRAIYVHELCNDGVQKKREIFFFLLRFFVYFLLLFLLPKLLQGLFTTWLQAQKHTKVHSRDLNLKNHVQGNQVYLGLHHLM